MKYQRGNGIIGVIIIVGVVWWVGSLFSNEPSHKNTYQNFPSFSEVDYSYDTSSVHYDDSYEYNYRSGYSGSYEYNYDVEGYGDDGYVYGTVDTSGKYGEGYIYDEYGNELWVETEWTDYGVLEAYDENGNWYELETY